LKEGVPLLPPRTVWTPGMPPLTVPGGCIASMLVTAVNAVRAAEEDAVNLLKGRVSRARKYKVA